MLIFQGFANSRIVRGFEFHPLRHFKPVNHVFAGRKFAHFKRKSPAFSLFRAFLFWLRQYRTIEEERMCECRYGIKIGLLIPDFVSNAHI